MWEMARRTGPAVLAALQDLPGSAMTSLTDRSFLPLAESPLGRTVALGPTDIWNDSCAEDELRYAVDYGAVGATANPTIVMDVWKKDPTRWRERLRAIAAEHPSATEDDLAWAMVEEMSLAAAPLLLPSFERYGGRKGRLSMQTNPTFFRTHDRMLAQGIHFASLAPNIIVKFPATSVGIGVMEEATYHGVNVNCTVSFSVAQAVAAAAAVERGLQRREAEGLGTDDMGPVITIMVGRLEDWLRVQTERDGIIADPTVLAWSGVAVFKRACAIFEERGYRARPLVAAVRHHLHWSQFIGGECVLTLPFSWQKRFNASDVEVRPRMADPVDPAIVAELSAHYPDFVRAFEPDGLSLDEFDTFPPTLRTLRQFVGSYHELLTTVSDAILPDPDRKSA
jgi:transaldolase